MIKILFVCVGNICRSPAAEGIMIKKLEERGLSKNFLVDSAGLHSYHEGERPDARMREHGRKRGYDFDSRSSQITFADIADFDYIICMADDIIDALNEYNLTAEEKTKIKRMTDYCVKIKAKDVPDPYYGGAKGFELVLDILEDACEGLIAHLTVNS